MDSFLLPSGPATNKGSLLATALLACYFGDVLEGNAAVLAGVDVGTTHRDRAEVK
jgi:hypothetical protein